MEFLDYPLLQLSGQTIKVWNLVLFVSVLIGAKAVVWIIGTFLSRQLSARGMMDAGRRHATLTIAKYFIYMVSFMVALQALGVNITVLVAGSTALFVGLGLGLQNTFKDFMGGIILLFEGSLEIEDVVELDGMVGRVKRIGLRTSTIQTRDDISIIVPNSKLVSENVINWSHQESHVRMQLKVKVGYESDPVKITRVLVECASQHPDVSPEPKPRVFLQEFGDYSFEFTLLFWTIKTFEAEQTMSDLRYSIEAAFKREGILFPYPVQDIRLPQDRRG